MSEISLKIIKEMLIDRGYTINDHPSSDYDLYAENKSKRLLCFFSKEDKLKIQEAKEKLYIMNQNEVKRAIIVYQNDITPSAKKSFETLHNYHIELFSLKELQFNPTTHRLVPKHELVISEQEKEELKEYQGKLPSILYNDIIRRYYDFSKGDIIRIIRKNNQIVYRVVK